MRVEWSSCLRQNHKCFFKTMRPRLSENHECLNCHRLIKVIQGGLSRVRGVNTFRSTKQKGASFPSVLAFESVFALNHDRGVSACREIPSFWSPARVLASPCQLPNNTEKRITKRWAPAGGSLLECLIIEPHFNTPAWKLLLGAGSDPHQGDIKRLRRLANERSRRAHGHS